VAQRRQRPATYEDLKQVPDTMVGEILDGELIVSPRPGLAHARASLNISLDLAGPFDRSAGGAGGGGARWWFLAEPELHLHGDVIVPDLAAWRRERMPAVPNAAACELAPDWACEIISPRTATHDRRQKMRIYAREGVGFLWLVDPVAKSLEVYRLEGQRWSTAGAFAENDSVRAEPFESVELDLARWWLEAGP
jgi:Uma2 family endonuclease